MMPDYAILLAVPFICTMIYLTFDKGGCQPDPVSQWTNAKIQHLREVQ